ncbi:MAG: class I SAM-dependent RNA methyltransferase [Acidobacteriota bacterium]
MKTEVRPRGKDTDQTFHATVERIIPGGKGLARSGSLPLFIPLAVPGDEIETHTVQDRGSYLEVKTLRILRPSPHRREPPCPYFGRCGGCDFQQMNESLQLNQKRAMLLDALKRIAKIDYPADRIGMTPSPSLRYRNRLQLRTVPSTNGLDLGFFQAQSHRVLPVDDCLIASGELWSFVRELKSWLEQSQVSGKDLSGAEITMGDGPSFLVDLQMQPHWNQANELQKRLQSLDWARWDSRTTFFLSEDHDGQSVRLAGPGYVWKTVGEISYRIGRGAFFQVNDPMLEALRLKATAGYRGRTALDLFCGGGFFTFALAGRFRNVIGVESNQAAIWDFEAAQLRNGISNCWILGSDLTQTMPELRSHSEDLDLILLDPPRSGLPKEIVRQLAELAAPEVVYVSCDPSTLARDLRILMDHHYRLHSLEVLDLFPQTHHVESVAKLKQEGHP